MEKKKHKERLMILKDDNMKVKKEIEISDGMKMIRKAIPSPIRVRCKGCNFAIVGPLKVQKRNWVCPNCGMLQSIDNTLDVN